MFKNHSIPNRPAQSGAVLFRIVLSLALLLVSLLPLGSAVPIASAQQIDCNNPQTTINWGTIGWNETPNTAPAGPATGINTYSDTTNHYLNPFHGLGSDTGGLDNFLHQSFSDVHDSGVDITVYYSQNMNDQGDANRATPNLYGEGTVGGPNPDGRVTGINALRFTRDREEPRTPMTVVVVFSQPVLMNEFLVGSLSQIGGNHEFAMARAFASADATGDVVKATTFNNISQLSDDSTLLHDQGDPSGPMQVYGLENTVMDPQYTFDGNGVGQNIGSDTDDGIYAAIGALGQTDGRYGRVLLKWDNEATPVRSIAVSTWKNNTTNFNTITYETTNHSVIIAPFTFTPCSEITAVSFVSSSTDGGRSPFVWLTLGLLLMTVLTLIGYLIFHQARTQKSDLRQQ